MLVVRVDGLSGIFIGSVILLDVAHGGVDITNDLVGVVINNDTIQVALLVD